MFAMGTVVSCYRYGSIVAAYTVVPLLGTGFVVGVMSGCYWYGCIVAMGTVV